MKRTLLKRSTQPSLKRSTKLRPVSKARQSRRADASAERDAWGLQWSCCMVCGRLAELDTHEIAPRSKSFECFVLANLLAVCRFCHDVLQGWLPTVVQLAFKLLSDPANYDLQEVNRLRKRGPDSITHQEVKLWAEFIRAMRGDR